MNLNKTKTMLLTPSYHKFKNFRVDLDINDTSIGNVNEYKYLGITIDKKLNFQKHIKQVKKNVTHKSYILNRISKFLTGSAALKIYKTHVLPLFDNGDLLYHDCNTKLLDMLQRLQNNCLKICNNKPKMYNTLLLHKECKIPFLKERRKAHIRNYSHKYSKCDKHIKKPVRLTRSNKAPVLQINKPTCKAITNSIFYKCAIIWNQLGSEIRKIEDEKVFKKMTKKDLQNTIV